MPVQYGNLSALNEFSRAPDPTSAAKQTGQQHQLFLGCHKKHAQNDSKHFMCSVQAISTEMTLYVKRK